MKILINLISIKLTIGVLFFFLFFSLTAYCQKFELKTFTVDNVEFIHQIVIDNDGNKWLATNKGLFQIEAETDSIIKVELEYFLEEGIDFLCFHENKLWFRTYENKLFSKQLLQEGLQEYELDGSRVITDMDFGSQGGLVATDKGIYELREDYHKVNIVKYIYDNVQAVHIVDNSGVEQIFIGTDNHLYFAQGKKIKPIKFFEHNQITSIFQHEDTLWVGSIQAGKGSSLYKQAIGSRNKDWIEVVTEKNKENKNKGKLGFKDDELLKSIVYDNKLDCWWMVNGQLIQYKYQQEIYHFLPRLNDSLEYVNDLVMDRQGALWITTTGNEIYKVTTTKEKPILHGKEVERGTTFNFNIDFIQGDTIMTEEGRVALGELLTFLKEYPTTVFNIYGHTKKTNQVNALKTLSINRALAVKNELIANEIDASRILLTKGFGGEEAEEYEARTNKPNMRVEIEVVDY